MPRHGVEPRGRRHLHNPPPDIAEEDVVIAVGGRVVELRDEIVDVAASDEQIAAAVVVEVDDSTAPFHPRQAPGRGPRPRTDVLETLAGEVVVEDRPFSLVGGHPQVEPAVVVDIATVDPHAAVGLPDHVVGQPRLEADLRKLPGAVVAEEEIGGDVVENEDVCVAIPFLVETDHSHPRPHHRRDPGGDAFIAEPAIAFVAEERIGPGFVVARPVVEGHAPDPRGDMSLGGEADVVGGIEIEIAIPVGVEEGQPRAELVAIGGPGGGGDVDKRAVSHVPPHPLRPVVARAQVGEAVVVEIADGHPHAVGLVIEPGGRRDVVEAPSAPVAGEHGARPARGLGAGKIGPVGEVDIDPAVEVMVEGGDTGGHRLRDEATPAPAVVMDKPDAGGGSDVFEDDRRTLRRVRRRGGGGLPVHDHRHDPRPCQACQRDEPGQR